jgi:hypothetical protein
MTDVHWPVAISDGLRSLADVHPRVLFAGFELPLLEED